MRANAGLLGIVIISIGVFLALFAGILSSLLPWWLALALFVPPLVVWAGAKWPMVAMMVALLTAFGFLPIGLIMTDVTVLGFVVFMILVYRKNIAKIFFAFESLWVILLLLMFWGLVSIVYGYFYRGNYINYIYGESITLAYWLILIPIMLIANDQKRANYTLYALLAVSVLLSIVAVLQSAFGLRLNFSGLAGVAELSSVDGGMAGLLRSMLPGVLVVIFTFVLSVIKLVTRAKNSYLWWILCLLNTMGLFVTFGRGVWAMTGLTTILAAALVGKNALVRLIFIGGFFATIFISIAFVVKPDYVIAAVDRILSVQTELSGKGTSYAWRVQENHFANIVMRNNPIVGIGLGGEYKPRLIDMRAFSGQTFYIHNGYYYVTLKLGLIGLVFYMANYLNIIRLCWINQKTPGVDRIPQMALISVFTGTLILNVTQPEFMQGPSIASMACIAAVVLALGMWQRNPSNLQNVPTGA